MQQEHIKVLNELIDGIMTTGLGLVKDDKVTPELKAALDIFLPVLKEQSLRQVMRYLGAPCMPHWMVAKIHRYPSTHDFEVATQEECDEFLGENMSGDDQEMSIDHALDRLSIGPTAQPNQDEIMAVDNVFGPVPSSFDPIESFEDEGLQGTNNMTDCLSAHTYNNEGSSNDEMISTWSPSPSPKPNGKGAYGPREPPVMWRVPKEKVCLLPAERKTYKYADMKTYITNPKINCPEFTSMPAIMWPLWDMYWLAMDLPDDRMAQLATEHTRKLFASHEKTPTPKRLSQAVDMYKDIVCLGSKYNAARRLIQLDLAKKRIKREDVAKLYDGGLFA
ncbi:hypothetical protein EDC04DRAFT_2607648 [Pisolithus marmoratus]|nr:hypothetical protein EDC04DRAFT_2607648 [Pisolithus marmoratus]